MTDEQISKFGAQAKELLENEILQKAMASLDEIYVEVWRKAQTVEKREDAFRYVQLCKQFKSDLQAIIKDGQIAQHRIKELEGQKGGLRKIWG